MASEAVKEQPEGQTVDEIVIELANALNRFRSLTDRESRWLYDAIRRERYVAGNERYWKPTDIAKLTRMIRRGRKPRDIAKTLGRTEQAVWSKIRMLRRQNKLGLICASHPRAGQCLVADDDGAVG
jgi:hypothetical protein